MTYQKKIIEALKEKGITELTETQKLVVKPIKDGKNVLLIAPTGSGKTEAVILPLLEKITSAKKKIFLLYITPLKALNRDMLDRLQFICKKLDIDVKVRYGDTTQSERKKLSKNPPDILITTPETFQIMFTGKLLRAALKNVKSVIVDEVHELAGNERGAQLVVGLERLQEIAGDFQRIALSATIGNPKEIASFIFGNRENQIIKSDVVKNLELNVLDFEEDSKLSNIIGTDPKYAGAIKKMWEIIENHKGTLIFVNTRTSAEDLGMRFRLWKEHIPIEVHHGSLSAEVRINAEENFKKGKTKALICTSSLELGIDIGHVDYVLQFNSPRQVTKLVQRIGRAGHGIGKTSAGAIITYDALEKEESRIIINKALASQIENIKIRQNPLSVLANQVIAIANSEKEIEIKKAFQILKRTHIFKNLKLEKFSKVLEFLNEIRVIRIDETKIKKGMATIRYFYENISMIPDERMFMVIDFSSKKMIGLLDERFVSSIELGSTFILKGVVWRVMEFKDEKMYVEGLRDVAKIPRWIGEEIPVPYEIAKEISLKEIRFGKNKLSIEIDKNIIFMGMPFGTKVNFTLGEIIKSFLSARKGNIETKITPYYILMFPNTKIEAIEIQNILQELTPESLESILKVVIRNSEWFNGQFIYVAKKFGIIAKDADYKNIKLSRIIENLKDTPVFEETINKIIWDYIDLGNTKKILKNIKSGKISIDIYNDISEWADRVIEQENETIKPTLAILKAIKNRLLNEKIKVGCLSCKKVWSRKVNKIDNTCPICASIKITLFNGYEKDNIKAFKKGKTTTKLKKELIKRSHILRWHGLRGGMALAGRGIGSETAVRILEVPYKDELEFIKAIFRAEITYARNRQFWNKR